LKLKTFLTSGIFKILLGTFGLILPIVSSGTTPALKADGIKSTSSRSFRENSFFLNDSYILGGFNHSGIYYSNSFKDLSYRPGFQFGIEQYIPMKRNLFLSGGLHFSQRNFRHNTNPAIIFKNNYIDLPFYACFELPILKDVDLRFLLGAQVGVRLGSSQKGNYSETYLNDGSGFVYSTDNFHRFDGGWSFGFSMEKKDFIFKLRSYLGFAKLDKSEQGMMHSLNADVGYFIFRQIKRNR
jgi:hypothetical protein